MPKSALNKVHNIRLSYNCQYNLELRIILFVVLIKKFGLGEDSDGSRLLHEFVDRDVEAIGARLHSNSPEFGGFKIGIVDGLPKADIVDGRFVV